VASQENSNRGKSRPHGEDKEGRTGGLTLFLKTYKYKEKGNRQIPDRLATCNAKNNIRGHKNLPKGKKKPAGKTSVWKITYMDKSGRKPKPGKIPKNSGKRKKKSRPMPKKLSWIGEALKLQGKPPEGSKRQIGGTLGEKSWAALVQLLL